MANRQTMLIGHFYFADSDLIKRKVIFINIIQIGSLITNCTVFLSWGRYPPLAGVQGVENSVS